jgi:farnesyl-diphosphate farnesyltransferase
MAMSLLRVDELVAMVRVKMQYQNVKVNLRADQEDLRFCYDILTEVSRSFAVVIIQLHPELRDAVALFYLVLRGLDTVEDDMSVPLETKKQVLPTFHRHLYDATWCVKGIGEDKERELLERFYCVSREFMKLKTEYRDVISDICERMAHGMLHFLQNEVITTADYELYCHYVAGLVGHGLTRLFACSGLEDPAIAKDLTIANSMGLFLQKVNITRDYFEDIVQEPPRMFWPKDIWGMFAPALADLKKPGFESRAVECCNAMVTNALAHIPDCLEYMSRLREPSVFLFCAIPQVMAIATLTELYNNIAIYHDKVKISKGATCKIIINSTDMRSLLQQFEGFCTTVAEKLVETDPSYDVSRRHLQRAFEAIREHSVRCGCDQSPSYARRFLVQYPALGGRMLFNMVDNFRAFLKPAEV